MSCDHHDHDHDDQDDHDLIAAGLAQPKRNIIKKCCILYPDDKSAYFWEIIISLVLLISCFTTPISLAFPKLEDYNEGYSLLQNILDLIFMVEIFINFRYAFEDETYQIHDDSKDIAATYIKGWFLIDVVSIFPIDVIMKHYTINEAMTSDEE